MATFIVGDIHGNATALGTLLVSIEKELREEDAIVFLGDYIDRGPNSRGCVEQILHLRDRTSKVFVLGTVRPTHFASTVA